MVLTPPTILPVVTLSLNLAIGLMVYWRNPSSRPARAFLLLMVIFALWQGAAALQRASTMPEAVLWNKVQYLGAALVLPGFTFFTSEFLRGTRTIMRNAWLRRSIYIVGTLMAVLCLSDLVITDDVASGGYIILGQSYTVHYGEFGPLYELFMVFFLVTMVLNFAAYFQTLRVERSKNRKRGVTLILVGALFTGVLGSITDVVLPLLGTRMPTAELLTMVDTLFIAVAMIRYKVFSLRAVATRKRPGVKDRVEWGTFVVVPITKKNEHIAYFKRVVRMGHGGIVLTGSDRAGIKKRLAEIEVPIIQITDEDGAKGNFDPTQLSEIEDSFALLFQRAERSTVLIDSPELFIGRMMPDHRLTWEFVDLFKKAGSVLKERKGSMVIPVRVGPRGTTGGTEVHIRKVADLWWRLPMVLAAIQEHGFVQPVLEGERPEKREIFAQTLKDLSDGRFGVEERGDRWRLVGTPPGDREDLIRALRYLILASDRAGIEDGASSVIGNADRLGILEPEIMLHPGSSYIILGMVPDLAYDHLRVLGERAPALCITKRLPEKVRRAFGPDLDCEMVWISKEGVKKKERVEGATVMRPDLERISRSITDFISKHDNGIVLLDGLEYLISQSGSDDVLRFMERVVDNLSLSKGVLLVPIIPGSVEEKDLALLHRLMDEV